MNKEYKNFNGKLTADLDLDSEKDFVNQAGTWSDIQETITQYGGESSDTLSDLTTTIEQAGATNQPTESVQEKLDRRRSANKGKGIGAFAKGLGQGLGLLTGGEDPTQAGTQIPPPRSAGNVTENKNIVIPVLIGLIGVGILIFVIGQSKKGKATIMPMPTA